MSDDTRFPPLSTAFFANGARPYHTPPSVYAREGVVISHKSVEVLALGGRFHQMVENGYRNFEVPVDPTVVELNFKGLSGLVVAHRS
ncbi:MAG: hypothetical protein WD273_02685 [Trueperaceae bacterium]